MKIVPHITAEMTPSDEEPSPGEERRAAIPVLSAQADLSSVMGYKKIGLFEQRLQSRLSEIYIYIYPYILTLNGT